MRLLTVEQPNSSLKKNLYNGDRTNYEGYEIEDITFQFELQQINNEPTDIQEKSVTYFNLNFAFPPNLMMCLVIDRSLKQICHHQIVLSKVNL